MKTGLFWYPPGCAYAKAEILNETPDEHGRLFVRFIDSNANGCFMAYPKFMNKSAMWRAALATAENMESSDRAMLRGVVDANVAIFAASQFQNAYMKLYPTIDAALMLRAALARN